jgi:hypothetical protein
MPYYPKLNKLALQRLLEPKQYASSAFREVLKEYGITSSMSRRGNCWDTQSKITSSAASGLTRAGIGVMPLC